MIFFDADALIEWSAACLTAAGVLPEHAQIVSNALVQTNLWGIDSHGIARLPHYLARLQAGSIAARPEIKTTITGPCTAQLDGGNGLGIVICTLGMELASRMAQENGIGMVGISESSHCGALGLYTRSAARQGLIGIAFTHSDALVIPFGGERPFLGTNPISIAFPRLNSEPLCLDMATSAVAWNRVMNARRLGETLPQHVAAAYGGVETTDPRQAIGLFPLGGEQFGYKGYGLGLMVELLCGPLNGMAYGPDVSVMYGDLTQPRRLGSLVAAIDPLRFAGGRLLEQVAMQLTTHIQHEPGQILLPSDPEYCCEQQRQQEGIPIDPALLDEFNSCSDHLGIPRLACDPQESGKK